MKKSIICEREKKAFMQSRVSVFSLFNLGLVYFLAIKMR